MDYLYKLFSETDSQAIEARRRVIYRQLFLCCEDVSITKIPLLRQNAGVTLVILNTVQAIKFNKDEFQELAIHAADLIVGIWRSYKNAKYPEKWLSPPLRDILRGLLENLYSMRVFVEDQVSTNVVFRMMGNAIDMRQIDKYHQRLTITFDKFEIESHISTSHLLIQLLEKQKEMSNEIQQRNGMKNIAAKRDNSKPKAKKGVSTTLRTELDRPTKKPVKKVQVARKLGQHAYASNSSSKIDSEDTCQWDEALPSITPCKTTRSSMTVLPPTPKKPMDYRRKSHYRR